MITEEWKNKKLKWITVDDCTSNISRDGQYSIIVKIWDYKYMPTYDFKIHRWTAKELYYKPYVMGLSEFVKMYDFIPETGHGELFVFNTIKPFDLNLCEGKENTQQIDRFQLLDFDID